MLDIKLFHKLPPDILDCIHAFVLELRKPRKIEKHLLNDIVSFHSIHDLKANYLRVYGSDDNEYLYWLENNLLFYLNGMESLAGGLSAEFMNVFPNKSEDQILEYVFMNTTSKRCLEKDILKYWCYLSPIRRTQFATLFL